MTRGVRDHLRDRAEVNFEDLGEHSVKNIRRPVRVFRAIFDPLNDEAVPDVLQKSPVESMSSTPAEEITDSASEVVFWQSVQASGDDAEYRLYLDRYPSGTFAKLAQARLEGASAIDDPQVELAFGKPYAPAMTQR